MNGFTDIDRGTLGCESGTGKEAKPLVSWLLAASWKALCEAGAGNTDGGNTDVGEVTNALESPPEALLKGLLGERAAGGG